MSTQTVKVFYQKEKGDTWVFLPETTQYAEMLAKNNHLPNRGDHFNIVGQDGVKHLGLSIKSLEHICTVKFKWFNYASCDCAIVLHYEVF